MDPFLFRTGKAYNKAESLTVRIQEPIQLSGYCGGVLPLLRWVDWYRICGRACLSRHVCRVPGAVIIGLTNTPFGQEKIWCHLIRIISGYH